MFTGLVLCWTGVMLESGFGMLSGLVIFSDKGLECRRV